MGVSLRRPGRRQASYCCSVENRRGSESPYRSLQFRSSLVSAEVPEVAPELVVILLEEARLGTLYFIII